MTASLIYQEHHSVVSVCPNSN